MNTEWVNALVQVSSAGRARHSFVHAVHAKRGLVGQGSPIKRARFCTHRGFLDNPPLSRQTLFVPLSRDQITQAIERLDARLGEQGVSASLYLVGGAVMCLALNEREATKDVDAWFTEPRAVRAAALRVAEELALPEDWLNDAAKAFIPERAGFELWRHLVNLEVLVANVETLFAMKCAAARTEEDAADIRALAERLAIGNAEEAIALVLQYFPASRLPVRTRLLLEELLDEGG